MVNYEELCNIMEYYEKNKSLVEEELQLSIHKSIILKK